MTARRGGRRMARQRRFRLRTSRRRPFWPRPAVRREPWRSGISPVRRSLPMCRTMPSRAMLKPARLTQGPPTGTRRRIHGFTGRLTIRRRSKAALRRSRPIAHGRKRRIPACRSRLPVRSVDWRPQPESTAPCRARRSSAGWRPISVRRAIMILRPSARPTARILSGIF